MNTNQSFKQRQLKPATETGSFINMMMSSNSTLPAVGKGATILGWTDRHAYEVMSVSKDYKTVVIQQYQPKRIDNLGMSDSQDYEYEKLSGYNETIVWKWGSWKKVSDIIVYDYSYQFNRDDKEELFNEHGKLRLIEGKTKAKKEHSKVNIIFGIKNEYYDYSF